MEQVVESWRAGRVGRIRLNRLRALNALDVPMIAGIQNALFAWRDDPAVHAVVIDSASERAFCAGGDVRAVREAAMAGDAARVEAFFAAEYALNLMIADYPKPFVALVDGICMGGGIGISVHGSARVATEHAIFAMPETAIALFPDVGTSYILPRLPGELGTWLALTGARLAGADAVHAGLATHFVPRARLADLVAALESDGVAALAEFAGALPAFSLAPHRALIDACFSAATAPEILSRLAARPEPFAAEALSALRAASPASVVWSLALLREGAARGLAQCLSAELAMTRHVTMHADFIEGVRAAVVDKDRQPRWTHASIEAVPEAEIAAMLR